MKKSELTFTGESYRLTPNSWGETSIMIDEMEAAKSVADAFSIDISECDPDSDPNDRPWEIEIATGPDGEFYAVCKPQYVSGGRVINDNIYRECENPENVSFGSVCLYGRWVEFDEED